MADLSLVNMPLVSVILPVYNGAAYLREAIECILDQTYSNFELIIINDGSKDNSAVIIEQFYDPRIRFYRQTNQGLAATLNRAIGLAKGEYIARQDQDDISLPQRFEKQVAFLLKHPEHGMIGTWAEIMVGEMETKRVHRHPTDDLTLKFELLFTNPFVHSSMMIRREVFDRVGLYSTDSSRQPPEDFELWSRVARVYQVANIPEILHMYREVPHSMSRVGPNPFLDHSVCITAENIAFVTGRSRDDRNIFDLAALEHGAYYKFSPHLCLAEINSLLREVANKLAHSFGAESGVVSVLANERFVVFRRRYLKYRYGALLGTALAYVQKLINWSS
jgi:glycosyltransferase involved in cell wall biosynthesis